MKQDMSAVKFTTLKKMVESLEKSLKGSPINIDDMDITFEYIVGSLFPKALEEFKVICTQHYIDGYNESLTFGEPEHKEKFKFVINDLERAKSTLENIQRLEDITDNDAAYAYELALILDSIKTQLE